MNISEQQHWDSVYSTKEEEAVSWFQPYPKRSMEFVELFNLPLDANIIDIGGGDSHFVDALLDKGYQNIYVLDISVKAIERAKRRLQSRAARVHWIVADVAAFEPPVLFDFWHDRAAFHFLTTETTISNYVSIARDAIRKDGYLILGTFSESGPTKCSGLEIRQYSAASMSSRFETDFDRVKCFREDHITPSNTIQNFQFCSFKRNRS